MKTRHRLIRKIARLLKHPLSRRSVYIDRMVEAHILRAFARTLSPVKTRFDLVRIGGAHDGGYLLPDDLDDIAACFSPGVAQTASFEEDLLKRKGIPSHLADYSVDGPPAGFQPASFTRKFIGTVNDEQFMTLEHWVKSQPEYASGQDFLLQMDIEGWEYPVLLSTPDEILKRFRIIVLELHAIESWGNQPFFMITQALFGKLLTHFHVVHNHPNNFCGTIDLGGFLAPNVTELALLRKDRSQALGYCTRFPHPLDAPCVLSHKGRPYAELVLPPDWRQAD